MENLMAHRSIRKYKSDEISEGLLMRILEAGSRASTTGNMQLYSIIVSKEKELREKLWANHFKQPMVLEAPVHLTFCADINRFHTWCEMRNAKPAYDNFLWFINAAIDAVLVSQNVVIAAEANGLGACYLGTITYMADKFIEILSCPQGVIPVAAIVIGYPDENPGLTDRLPLEAVVHKEKYVNYTEDSINRLYSEKEALTLTKQLIQENEVANLAQVFTEKRYKKADNLHFSKGFFEILKKQGFFNQD